MSERRPPKTAEPKGERDSRESWEGEGGSVDETVPRKARRGNPVVSGRTVQAGGPDQPYKVVLTHEDGHTSERACATVREGEAFIRSVIPVQPRRDTSRDRGPGQS
jgi:hypothetical protein